MMSPPSHLAPETVGPSGKPLVVIARRHTSGAGLKLEALPGGCGHLVRHAKTGSFHWRGANSLQDLRCHLGSARTHRNPDLGFIHVLSILSHCPGVPTSCQRRRTGTQGACAARCCTFLRPGDIARSIQQGVAAQFAWGWVCRGGWKWYPAPDQLAVAPIYRSTASSRYEPVGAHDGEFRSNGAGLCVASTCRPVRRRIPGPRWEAALASAHLALELIDSRHDAQGATHLADKLADGLNQGRGWASDSRCSRLSAL